MTGWVGNGRAVDLYLNFSKAFNIDSYFILTGKLRKRGLDQWALTRIDNWLTGRAQRLFISGPESSWSPVASDIPIGEFRVWSCSTCSSAYWMKGQREPSAYLSMLQSWDEWLVCQKTVLPCRLGEAGELCAEEPYKAQQRQVQLKCPFNQSTLEADPLKSCSLRRYLGVLRRNRLATSHIYHPCLEEWPTTPNGSNFQLSIFQIQLSSL